MAKAIAYVHHHLNMHASFVAKSRMRRSSFHVVSLSKLLALINLGAELYEMQFDRCTDLPLQVAFIVWTKAMNFGRSERPCNTDSKSPNRGTNGYPTGANRRYLAALLEFQR